MSMIKHYMENRIEQLAVETGYTEEYLHDIWNECLDDGETTWDDFVAITQERDW